MTTIILATIAGIVLFTMTLAIIGIAAEREREKNDQMFTEVDKTILREFLGNKNGFRYDQDRR